MTMSGRTACVKYLEFSWSVPEEGALDVLRNRPFARFHQVMVLRICIPIPLGVENREFSESHDHARGWTHLNIMISVLTSSGVPTAAGVKEMKIYTCTGYVSCLIWLRCITTTTFLRYEATAPRPILSYSVRTLLATSPVRAARDGHSS